MNRVEFTRKYTKLMHAMQSGVAMEMNYDEQSTTPKHLRVGVNSALVDTSAMSTLLIKKGLITEEEYYDSIIEQAEKEVNTYKKRLEIRFGRPINLA